ncbi:MAG: hypothetical protein ACYC1C_06020 [Chloroflexota bacterium]
MQKAGIGLGAFLVALGRFMLAMVGIALVVSTILVVVWVANAPSSYTRAQYLINEWSAAWLWTIVPCTALFGPLALVVALGKMLRGEQ